MDEVCSKVGIVAIGKLFLVHASAYPVPAFEDGDFETVLQEDVRTSKARETCPDDANVGIRPRLAQFPLVDREKKLLGGFPLVLRTFRSPDEVLFSMVLDSRWLKNRKSRTRRLEPKAWWLQSRSTGTG